jgi:hypothetical protein
MSYLEALYGSSSDKFKRNIVESILPIVACCCTLLLPPVTTNIYIYIYIYIYIHTHTHTHTYKTSE